jgi:hypothetical protein
LPPPHLAADFSLTGRRRNRFLPSLAATTPRFLPPPISPSLAAELIFLLVISDATLQIT